MFSVHVLRCRPRREFRKAKCRCSVGTDRDGGAAKGGTDPMVRLPSGGHACAPGMRPGAALFETNETSARVEPYPIPFPWPLLYALLCFACFTLLGVQKPCPVPSVWPAPHIQVPHKTNPLVHKHRKRASHSHHHTIPYQSIHRPTQTHQSTHPPPDAFQSRLEHTGVKGRRALDPLAPGRPGAIVVVVVFPGEQQLLVGDPRGEVPVVGCWWWLWWCFG